MSLFHFFRTLAIYQASDVYLFFVEAVELSLPRAAI